MGHLTAVTVMADPFVYNYERLRIGGLICACLLVAGGVGVILYNKCSRKEKKGEDDSSEI